MVRGGLVVRVSRRVGAGGVANQGQGARSFSACGAPPGPLPLVCFEASSPTRRDTRSCAPVSCVSQGRLPAARVLPQVSVEWSFTDTILNINNVLTKRNTNDSIGAW